MGGTRTERSGELKRPRYWTTKEDLIISQLFDWVSTEKLSILMQISVDSIVDRKQYLDNKIKNERHHHKPTKRIS